jgi:hypothetical protein
MFIRIVLLIPQKPLNWIYPFVFMHTLDASKVSVLFIQMFRNHIHAECVLTSRYIKVVLSEVKYLQFSLFAVIASRFTLALFQFLFYLIIYRFFSLIKHIWIPLISTCSLQIFLVSFYAAFRHNFRRCSLCFPFFLYKILYYSTM